MSCYYINIMRSSDNQVHLLTSLYEMFKYRPGFAAGIDQKGYETDFVKVQRWLKGCDLTFFSILLLQEMMGTGGFSRFTDKNLLIEF